MIRYVFENDVGTILKNTTPWDIKIANFRSSKSTLGQICLHSGLAVLVDFGANDGTYDGVIFGRILNMLDFESVCYMFSTLSLEHGRSGATTPWGT